MRLILMLTAAAMVFSTARPAAALEQEDYDQAKQAIACGIEHLWRTQGPDGSWTPQPGPAVTAMVLAVMLDQPGASPADPRIEKALAYVLARRQADGGIHEGFLQNYNTAIALSALARVNDRPGVAGAIKAAQDYLRGLQWAGQLDEQGRPVGEKHPFYGGAGYGNHGRPDMSNTQIMLQGLHDSGLDCNDPAFQRAMVFITRCQGTSANSEYGDAIVPDGGFIYATSISKDQVGQPQSMAGMVTMEDGTSRLATYGSMTYAGYKSYVYAQLDRDDPRVRDAVKWIRHNYRLDQNPGLRDDPATEQDERLQGYFYYLMTFARAMRAWGEPIITTADGQRHDWRVDLVRTLIALQQKDGSWANPADRWMEGDTNLVTAYALAALTEAMR